MIRRRGSRKVQFVHILVAVRAQQVVTPGLPQMQWCVTVISLHTVRRSAINIIIIMILAVQEVVVVEALFVHAHNIFDTGLIRVRHMILFMIMTRVKGCG
jgi:hypothetical protein